MEKFDRTLLGFERISAKIMLLVAIVLIFSSAVARFLGVPINWAVDISLMLFAYSCFFCADIAWREDKMMKVDMVVKKLPAKVQKWMLFINYLIISAFNAYMIIWGFYLAYSMRFRKVGGFYNVSYSWIALSVPIGAILLFRTTLLKLINEFRNRGA